MGTWGYFKEVYEARRLVWSLAKSDFKTRYVGSYFGLFWEIVQPLSLIFIFYFVFEVALGTKLIDGYPFVLWFILGLIPWFFFSDAWNAATGAFLQYSFLVKKMVFKTSVLPSVKIVSSFFTSIAFHIFLVGVLVIYGVTIYPSTIAVFYFLFCTFVLLAGVSLITSSIVVFFKDIKQILPIVLQFGLYLTPILWSESIVPSDLRWVLYLNPMFYVVQGYRLSLLEGEWFFTDPWPTLFFWVIALSLLAVGVLLYSRLRPHFADVL